MHPHSIHKLLPAFLLSFSFWSHAQEKGEPEKVDFDSNKWKTSDNLTIETLNKTNRTFALDPAESGKNKFEQFAYIPAIDNNKESYRITCKHLPAFHKETKATVTANIAWSLKDKNKKDLQKEKIQYWSLPYEVDLKDLAGNTLNVVCACMEATKKEPDSSSGEEKKRGDLHYGTIYDANIALGVKSMTFNTHPGVIENDAFDVVDSVKGRVINNSPEFLNGKQISPTTIVVYPVNSKPVVKVKLQMKSERLKPDKLQEIDWKPNAATHQMGEEEKENFLINILPNLKLSDSGFTSKEVKDSILFLEGEYSPQENLTEFLARGNIDLDWKLKIGEDEIKLRSKLRSKIDTAFCILRKREIDQTDPGDTKIWARGIVAAVKTFMHVLGDSYWTPRSDKDYAEHLTNGIFDHSAYPKEIVRRYSSNELVGGRVHYNIYLGRLVNLYLNDSAPDKEIICVEAAALFRSLYNLVTDGTASAASIKRRNIAHQIGMREGLVHDPTPNRKDLQSQPPFPMLDGNKNGTLNLNGYLDFLNKTAPANDPWVIKRLVTKHRVFN